MFDTPSLLTTAGVFVAVLAALYARWSAVAARESATIARTALLSTQRAFVFAPQVDALNILDPNTFLLQAIQIVPTWRNAGLTPARRLVAYIEHRMFAPNDAITISFDTPPPEVVRFDVAPQTTFRGNALIVSVSDIQLLIEQKCRLFIWGACEYNDVFDGTPHHVTKYCFEVEVAIDPRIPVNPQNTETHFLRFRAATEQNVAE